MHFSLHSKKLILQRHNITDSCFSIYLDKDLYHYWNPIHEEFQEVNISRLFRSNNCPNTKLPSPPSTTLYTGIKLLAAFVLFGVYNICYGLILTLIKNCINADFKSATHGKRFQHILETLNCPEAFGDWDNDCNLDVAGHWKKWKKVLAEMLLMVLMQLISNFILLVPFFVTGNSF